MRLAAVLLCGFLAAASAPAADSATLAETKTVYLLPMPNGLDQYLANQITRDAIFQVVTEPAKADAIITDRLGPDFERKMAELFPPPAPAEESKEEESGSDSSRGLSAPAPTPVSSLSRAKGTLFIVSQSSGTVLWSIFERPKSTAPKDLNRLAQKIAAQLERDLKVARPR
ncbi:MAG: hypothetical protein ACM3ZB_10660 [bacterium]